MNFKSCFKWLAAICIIASLLVSTSTASRLLNRSGIVEIESVSGNRIDSSETLFQLCDSIPGASAFVSQLEIIAWPRYLVNVTLITVDGRGMEQRISLANKTKNYNSSKGIFGSSPDLAIQIDCLAGFGNCAYFVNVTKGCNVSSVDLGPAPAPRAPLLEPTPLNHTGFASKNMSEAIRLNQSSVIVFFETQSDTTVLMPGARTWLFQQICQPQSTAFVSELAVFTERPFALNVSWASQNNTGAVSKPIALANATFSYEINQELFGFSQNLDIMVTCYDPMLNAMQDINAPCFLYWKTASGCNATISQFLSRNHTSPINSSIGAVMPSNGQ